MALASYPTYDPNDFATPISARKFAHYLNDPLQPLYNRAIGAATPTGSTFKMVTGTGAISSGVIGKDQVLYDTGSWNCHGVAFSDIASGGLGYDRLRQGARRVVGRLLLPARLPARPRAAALLRAAVRPRLAARHRPAGRVSGQLADRGVDASDVRQGLSPRAERRLPARDRPGRDASDAAADRRHAGGRAQRRDALPAAHRRGGPQPARQGAQDASTTRSSATSTSRARRCARSRPGWTR